MSKFHCLTITATAIKTTVQHHNTNNIMNGYKKWLIFSGAADKCMKVETFLTSAMTGRNEANWRAGHCEFVEKTLSWK